MIASLAVTAALATFSTGHIDNHGNVNHADAFRVSTAGVTMVVPPRTALTDESQCEQIGTPIVTLANGRQLRGHMVDQGQLRRYGNAVLFNGVSIANFSHTARVTIEFKLFDACR